MMKPPINASSPVSTRRRVEMLSNWRGAGKGVGDRELRSVARVLAGVKTLRALLVRFVAGNQPAEIAGGIGHPGLHVRDHPVPAPRIGAIIRRDSCRGADAARGIPAGGSPKTCIKKIVQPRRIARLGRRPAAARVAGIGSPFAPIFHDLEQVDRFSRSIRTRPRQEKRQRHVGDRRV